MNRMSLLLFLIYGLILAGLATRTGEVLILTIPLLIYLAAALLYRPEEFRVTAGRTLSADRVWPGNPVMVTLSITNEGSSLEELLIEDIVPDSLTLITGHPGLLTSLEAGDTVELTYTLQGERGYYHFPEVQLTAGDSLGLCVKRVTRPALGHFFILPEVVRVRRVAIRPRGTRVYSGLIPARQGGPGVEFFGVREYQSGDSLRWINGRATARHPGSLFINEFEQERVADVGLILDARQQSEAGSLFEYGVQAMAALAETFLRDGNRVGLLIYGRSHDWTLPGYGKVQRERILQALARAEPGEDRLFEKLEHLPTRLFPARSQLVLVSPLWPEDANTLITLRAQGYRLLVISPDPIAFEQKEFRPDRAVQLAVRLAHLERTLLLGQLRQADIQVVNWPVETPFPQVAQAVLERVQRAMPFQ